MLSARGLIKTFGKVIGLDGVDVDLYPGEVLAVIGDNGAGKSTLIKALTGALIPDSGQVFLDGREVHFRSPAGRPPGRHRDRCTRPWRSLRRWTSSANMFLGRERRRPGRAGLGVPDARQEGHEGGRRQVDGQPRHRHRAEHGPGRGDAVRWSAAGRGGRPGRHVRQKFVVLDEPTAALGVKETGQVLNLIQQIKAKGMPVILISHNMPNVFEVADRIHIARLCHIGWCRLSAALSRSDPLSRLPVDLWRSPEGRRGGRVRSGLCAARLAAGVLAVRRE